jgi:glyoxylase-like metal-dependent hydrolase (beta-lactamase superfamily II)
MNGQTLQVFHVKNAHTDGDAIIYFKESNVFHAGDVFVRYGLPFIDQPNGGSIDGMINGTDQLLALLKDDSKIIPGHGELATKKDLLEYKKMLQTIRDRVWKGIQQGKTLDQIDATDPAKEFVTGMDHKVFIKTVYDSLKK